MSVLAMAGTTAEFSLTRPTPTAQLAAASSRIGRGQGPKPSAVSNSNCCNWLGKSPFHTRPAVAVS